MRKKSFKAARFDKKYNKPDLRHHSNFMDLTHASGFLLACYFILRGRPENFFVMFAVMCSSFCKMNSGTSKRSKCNSIGFDAFPSVQASNMLLERSVLLIYLVTGLGGTWFVEQPNQSVLEYYPTFRKMLMDLFNVRDEMLQLVYDTKWWMCHYGSASPKRHYAYANTEKIYMLNQGKLYMKVWSRMARMAVASKQWSTTTLDAGIASASTEAELGVLEDEEARLQRELEELEAAGSNPDHAAATTQELDYAGLSTAPTTGPEDAIDVDIDDEEVNAFFGSMTLTVVKAEPAGESPTKEVAQPIATPARAPAALGNIKIESNLKLTKEHTRQEKLLLAARSRLNRMMKPHKKKTGLDVFMQRLEKIITKKEKYTIKVDEGWFSVAEMKAELKWHIDTLQSWVDKMEEQHEACQLVMSEGEVNPNAEFKAKAEAQMKTCSKAVAAETRIRTECLLAVLLYWVNAKKYLDKDAGLAAALQPCLVPKLGLLLVAFPRRSEKGPGPWGDQVGLDVETYGWAATRLTHPFAEASCSSTVRAARRVVADIGDRAAASSGGLLELSKCRENDAETDTHRLFVERLHLSLEPWVPLSSLTHNGRRLTVLRLRDWLQFLVDKSCWHILTGLVRRDPGRERAILKAFWQKFRCTHEDHPIFSMERAGLLSLERTAPLLYHGDEGRGRRRLTTNIAQTFVAGWPKKVIEAEGALGMLMQHCKDENDFVLHEGVVDRDSGEKFHACILAVCGDWQWLVKSGNLQRSYNHVVKATKEAANPEGVCHLCRAGQRGYSFEHLDTRAPAWLSTFLQQDPFLDPRSPLADLPHVPGAAATIFKFDVWHTCHLGICKALAGSALALLSETFPGRSKDARFEALSRHYLNWCAQNHRQALLTRILKETIGWDKNSNFPKASWYKGSLSTTMCDYIESVTKDAEFQDELLTKCGEAVQVLNQFISGLYQGDAFLEPATARNLGEIGLRFLRRYSWCVTRAHEEKRCLFLLLPKFHCLHHIALQDLLIPSQTAAWVVNPIVHSVQLAEDYIGRNSRTSRHTHPSTTTRRVAERHLQAAFAKYVEAQYLVAEGDS
ncbi:unnamed protein product [Symbiodinium sp. CCMP2456]|nr:unnamed protein product [Symbiodinium sp. CCMP2456]